MKFVQSWSAIAAIVGVALGILYFIGKQIVERDFQALACRRLALCVSVSRDVRDVRANEICQRTFERCTSGSTSLQWLAGLLACCVLLGAALAVRAMHRRLRYQGS